jgi:hypothetical protein
MGISLPFVHLGNGRRSGFFEVDSSWDRQDEGIPGAHRTQKPMYRDPCREKQRTSVGRGRGGQDQSTPKATAREELVNPKMADGYDPNTDENSRWIPAQVALWLGDLPSCVADNSRDRIVQVPG